MRRDYEATVQLARNLQQLHDSMVQYVGGPLQIGWEWTGRDGDRVLQTSGLSEEDARTIGAIEGAWQAFAGAVVRHVAGSGTPDSILRMDEKARGVAQEAYRRAYAEAVAGAGVPTA